MIKQVKLKRIKLAPNDEEMKRRLATRVAGKLSELSNAQLRELTVEDLG